MLQIIRTNSKNPDFRSLVKLLDEDLASRYNDDVHTYYSQFNKVDFINHVVLIYIDEKPVGCGAIKEYDKSTMEVKRMFVTSEARGRSIATKILKELEHWSEELGYSKCILETGDKQLEAIRLYSKNGYNVIPNYDQYEGLNASVCFLKNIKSMKPLVSIEWLIDHLNDPDLIILDASVKNNVSKATSDYVGLEISGAVFFDIKNNFSIKKGEVPNMIPNPDSFSLNCGKLGITNNSKIVVYDNLGVHNSPRVWWMFKVMGHKNVGVLDGGLPAWIKSGRKAVACSKVNIEPTVYETKFQSDLVKDVDQVFENIKSKEAIVMDARSKGRFDGISPEPRAGLRGGHIPSSVCLPYTEVVRSGKYKSKEELSGIFNSYGLGEKPLIFTCGSGVTACIILLAAELVGDNPKSLYDGSWTEWGEVDRLPIDQLDTKKGER